MGNFTQDMGGNRSFPEMPSPSNKPSLRTIPPKAIGPGGNSSKGIEGYGEQGDGIEVNTDAPYGNKKLVPAGKFVQQQMYKGTDLNAVAPVETSIRNVRVADPGAEFGRGGALPPLEIAGASRSLPKKFLPGGRSD